MAAVGTPPDPPAEPDEALAAAEAAHLAARQRGHAPGGPTGRSDRTRSGDTATDRARPAPPTRARRGAPLPLAAAVAAGWAATVSFVPVAGLVVLLAVAELGPAGVTDSLRFATTGWLLGHGVPVRTPVGPLGMAPLAVAALAAWRVSRAGVHVTRALGARGRGSFGSALLAAGAVAAGYGGLGALAALSAGDAEWGPSVFRSWWTLTGFGLVAAGYGSLTATGVLTRWRARLPAPLTEGVRSGLVAAAGVLAAGAALAGAAVAANGGAAADTVAAYRTGVAGQAGLTLLCLAYAPNLAGWAAAYLLGPGFAVGTGTLVSSGEVRAGPLPALPVFAAVPEEALPTVGAVLLAVPVAVGVAAGWRLAAARRAGRLGGWLRRWSAAVLAGAVAGVVLGLVAVGSGGPLGAGQLAELGPAPVPVALWSAATVAVGAVLGVTVAGLLTRRST